jgi:GWxTD domain-containing protein
MMSHIRVLGFFFLALGWAACGGGMSRVDLDPDSRDFYETAGLIMTGVEKDIFHHLPDAASRREFIQDFWRKRDPDPETPENEFREEFLQRIEYANAHFDEGRPGWKTDRGRIFIYFGPPDRIERRPMLNNVEIKAYQIWIYYRYNFGVEFLDRRGDGSYTMDPYSGVIGSFQDALNRAQLGLEYSSGEQRARFVDFELDYDDENRAFVVVLPSKKLTFGVDEQDEEILTAELSFEFFIYPNKDRSRKQRFMETRSLRIAESELVQTKKLTFALPCQLESGKYYIDALIIVRPEITKTRKIFNIRVK